MMGMASCREVTRAVATGSLDEASVFRRLSVRLHLLLCHHCRRYAQQLQAIGQAARELLTRPSGEHESLERLRKDLLGRLDPPRDDGPG